MVVQRRLESYNSPGWELLFEKFRHPGSPVSKKRRALDVAQQLKNRNHDQVSVPLENVTVETENDGDSDWSNIRIKDSYVVSP